jgi:SAM-dependent methyltransferase
MMRRRCFVLGVILGFAFSVLALAGVWPRAAQAATAADEPFSFYFPTPESTVQRLLEMARVTSSDFVMDLGSGDGRIVLVAARRYGAKGAGIDIDAGLVEKSNADARRQQLTGRVRFDAGDVMAADISRASVVTVFLLPALMARLQPKLLRELKPGTRIVAHEFALPDWPPDETLILYVPTRNAGSGGDSTLRLWTVPANFSGEWRWRVDDAAPATVDIAITQRYQRAAGSMRRGSDLLPLTNVSVVGALLTFTCMIGGVTYHVSARLAGDTLDGDARVQRAGSAERTLRFVATRISPSRPLDAVLP